MSNLRKLIGWLVLQGDYFIALDLHQDPGRLLNVFEQFSALVHQLSFCLKVSPKVLFEVLKLIRDLHAKVR
ncbi:hypothetical protein OR60_19230 [Xanthomonas vesicatoria]|uniref:Uncharacterized protein n=1 Tax=Xanthomonas vesicatoria TaxID=56460 RepID=A0AAJ0N2U9_9XANT|nr:hypothetical protein BI313_02120 [Xanthomonas vesicatoria]KHM91561.1 hypothetical protein OR60_19230 [Xanthomonas vesicatoria]KHM92000.1 hypothetical protein OR61_17740 [Xanthomonas vesicatoria]